MKYILFTVILLTSKSILSQGLRYSITVPNSAKEGVGTRPLPAVIDSNHYYTCTEIKDLAVPKEGWNNFYRGLNTLHYPKKAKAQQLQSSLHLIYAIDDQGIVDSIKVYAKVKIPWSKCTECEQLIIDYIKNTVWLPGKIREVPVKTLDDVYVNFSIYDPKAKHHVNPFE